MLPRLEKETELSAETPVFDVDNLPKQGWQSYRKTSTTRMVRMPGPFRVMTSETDNEPFLCEDGYLAVDARGYPYPIAASEHAHIYELADGET